jgi:hypothetical protein
MRSSNSTVEPTTSSIDRPMPRNLVGPGAIVAEVLAHQSHILSLIDAVSYRRTVKKLKLEVPRSVMEQVRKDICCTAYAYQYIRDNENAPTTNTSSLRDVNSELSSVSVMASELVAKVTNLSTAATDRIHAAEEIADYEMLISKSATSSFGHTFLRYKDTYGHDTQTYLHLPQIIGCLSVLRNMTARMAEIAAPAKKKFPNQAMRHFVTHMRIIWTEQIGRDDFTFAQHDGVFEGDATHFCWAFLKLIDPNASRSQFATAMRGAVEINHPGRGRRPRKSQNRG